MIKQIADNIYSFKIPLPKNPLKWLNSYFIPGQGQSRNLLIDTGFNTPVCYRALRDGMEELEAVPEETDVFLTHLHSDHTGNAAALAADGCRVLMGRVDYEQLRLGTSSNWAANSERTLLEGMPEEEMLLFLSANPIERCSLSNFQAECVEDGERLSYGGYAFSCLLTPGHTPGHMCLFDEDRQTIILGDHVLFDITPNITFWSGVKDSLRDYMSSLRRISRLDVKHALPGHRNCGGISLTARAEQLIRHHEDRLAELEAAVKAMPGLTAYELAGRIQWQVKDGSWDNLASTQRWFAMGETMAHLDYLAADARITREMSESTGRWVYS